LEQTSIAIDVSEKKNHSPFAVRPMSKRTTEITDTLEKNSENIPSIEIQPIAQGTTAMEIHDSFCTIT
jgi:hypothetical protein